jgi:hypothetical protein
VDRAGEWWVSFEGVGSTKVWFWRGVALRYEGLGIDNWQTSFVVVVVEVDVDVEMIRTSMGKAVLWL